MPALDDDLRESMAAHKAGRFDEAEAGYHRVLAAQPAHPKALYYLGLLQFHRGETAGAIELVRRCLSYAPSNAAAWNTLGGLLITGERKVEAREAYRQVTLLAPSMGEGWYNLGICLRDEGDVEGALAALRASIAHQQDYFRAHEALAALLYRLGRTDEAADVYREWASRDPGNPTARHMAAATSQQDVPARASDDYVRNLFDASAKSFDADLGRLGYRAPELVAAALARSTDGRVLPAILDAGCGTGLCGPLIRALCETLVGIDLSTKMLEHAKARGCYDELTAAELQAFMHSRPEAFDAIVSADTLVYFGALDEPLAAAHGALRPGGVLVFTLESLAADATSDYRLEAHGRYGHIEPYIRGTLQSAGLRVESLTVETLREERDSAVRGYVVVARRD
jgi:predicted TPR repeat methyltransferase